MLSDDNLWHGPVNNRNKRKLINKLMKKYGSS
jgi:hypothetical protein